MSEKRSHASFTTAKGKKGGEKRRGAKGKVESKSIPQCVGGVSASGGRTHGHLRSAEEEGVVSTNSAKGSIVAFSTQEFQERGGCRNFGNEYENKVAALLSLRCLRDDIKHMLMAMNASGYGDFDDIILYTETDDGKKHEYLLQLKFQLTPRCIEDKDFIKNTGDFSIQKYRDSVDKSDVKYARESGNVSHLEDIQDSRTFILFTTRSLKKDTYFNNYLDTFYKKLHLAINSNGLIFKFKPEHFNEEFDERNQHFLFTEQTGVQELDGKIGKEILFLIKPIQIPARLLADITKRFVDFLNHWTTGQLGGHYYLTKKIIWKVLGEELLASNMLPHEKQSCSNGNYEIWNKIIECRELIIIETDNTVTQFLNAWIANTISNSKKQYKKLRKRPQIRKQIFKIPRSGEEADDMEIYEWLWKTRQLPLLLKASNLEELNKIVLVLNKLQGDFSVIVLTNSELDYTTPTALKTFCNLNDLSDANINDISRQAVKFQGKTVELENIVNRETINLSVRDVVHILFGSFNVGNTLCVPEDYTIDRSLETVWLKSEVLLERFENLFVIQCDSINDFEVFVQNHGLHFQECHILNWPPASVEDTRLGDISIIVSEKAVSVGDISGCENKNIHYLTLHNKLHLRWIKSSRSIKSIKAFRTNAYSKSVYPVEHVPVNDNLPQTILISSDPGMGKTYFMDYVALHTPVDLWVLKINLFKHCDYYKTVGRSSKSPESHLQHFFNATVQEKCNSTTETVFKTYLKHKKLCILLDGYDEIPLTYHNTVNAIIKCVRKLAHSVYITTRPIFKSELEELLDTFAVNIKSFSETEQIDYLVRYFGRKVDSDDKQELVKEFAYKLHNSMKTNFNDNNQELVAIPLQIKMIAEIFTKQCNSFCQTRNFTSTRFDLIDLYDRFIKQRMDIVCEKFGYNAADTFYEFKTHMHYLALQQLFLDEDLDRLRIAEELQEFQSRPVSLQRIQQSGVVVPESKTNFRFVHRTFAEYLVADWLFENKSTDNREVTQTFEILLRKTFEPSYRFVRNLFDRILAIECPLHLAVLNCDIKNASKIIDLDSSQLKVTDNGGRKVLHLIAAWGTYHPISTHAETDFDQLKIAVVKDEMVKILKLIPKGLFINEEDEVLQLTPLDYAVASCSLHIADAICAAIEYENPILKFENSDNSYILSHLNKFLYGSLASVLTRQSVLKQTTEFIDQAIAQNHDQESLHLIAKNPIFTATPSEISSRHGVNVKDSLGCTAMHIAVICGNTDFVNLLLSTKADVNIIDLKGRTALHWAVITAQDGITELLLNNSADINLQDEMGMNVLHHLFISTTKKLTNIFHILIENCYLDTSMTIKDIYGKIPLFYALHYNQTEIVKLLLRYGADIGITNATSTLSAHLSRTPTENNTTLTEILSYTDHDGSTLLHWASDRGLTDIVKLILNVSHATDHLDNDKQTPLHCAVSNGHEDTAALLIKYGANIHLKNNIGETAFISAVKIGNKAVVSLLLNAGAQINERVYQEMTPLLWAARNGHLEIVQFLLDKGSDIKERDISGQTAILWATRIGSKETVSLLLNKGAQVNERDNEEMTPLLWAAQSGHSALVQFLLDRGSDITEKDISGETAISKATRIGSKEIVSLLFKRGAQLNKRDKQEMTPLLWAASNGHSELVEFLLDRGSDITEKNKFGITGISCAALKGSKETVLVFLNKGAQINDRDNEQMTPLLWATRGGHSELVEFLLDRASNISEENISGETAILCAATYGSKKTVSLLLNKGAQINEQDKSKMTPLLWAARNGHSELVEFLLGRGSNIGEKNILEQTSILCAAQNGHKETVFLLLNKGAQINELDNEKMTPLLWAASKGHSELVKFLLDNGSNVGERNISGQTSILCAAQNGHKETVSLLLNKGAQINELDNEKMTPLLWAASKGHSELVKFLLGNGSNVGERNISGQTSILCAAQNGHKETAFLLLNKGAQVNERDNEEMTPLLWAARKGHSELVDFLLNNNSNIREKNNMGQTGILLAAACGSKETVSLLLKKGADINERDNDEMTPLLWASNKGHSELVKLLLDSGSNISEKNLLGQTSILCAALNGSKETVSLLLNNGAEIQDRDKKKMTPLLWAAIGGHLKLVEFLLDNGSDINEKSNSGQTSILYAAAHGSEETVSLLLNKGAEINERDSGGMTPLLWAANRGHSNLVKFLLESESDISEKNNLGQTSILCAALNGHKETVSLLLDKGAQVNERDNEEMTPLLWAASKGFSELVEILLNSGSNVGEKNILGQTSILCAAQNGHKETVSLLLNKGAQINERDNEEMTPLLWATSAGNSKFVEFLLDKGSDISETNNLGQTSILFAALNGNTATVSLLLNKGAQINERDNGGMTPLLWAAHQGHSELVEFLLDKGSDISEKNYSGETSIQCATRNGRKETVSLLLNKGAQINNVDNE